MENDELFNSYEASQEHQEQELEQAEPSQAIPGTWIGFQQQEQSIDLYGKTHSLKT